MSEAGPRERWLRLADSSGGELAIRVVDVAGARHLRLSVGRDGPRLSKPRWVPLRDAEAFAREKRDWLEARLREREAAPPPPSPPPLHDGARFPLPLRGDVVTVQVASGSRPRLLPMPAAVLPSASHGQASPALDRGDGAASAAATGDLFASEAVAAAASIAGAVAEITTPIAITAAAPTVAAANAAPAPPANAAADLALTLPPGAPERRQRQAARLLRTWLEAQLRADLGPLLARHTAVLGRAPLQVRVRPLRSLWGSLTARGQLSLDLSLVLAEPAVLEYVLVHELCHLREHNHGPRFWAQVARLLPDYRTRQAQLRRDGEALKATLAALLQPAR